jgi:glycogen operon protein
VRDFWRGAASIGELGWRLTGSADLFTHDGRRPFASVNFVTAHDGFTLRDLVTYDHKHNEANGEDNRDGTDDNRSANYGVEGETDDPGINDVRHRQMRNLLATLALSTGVPMLTAGDEIGRTQRGNNNAYCQDNPISWLDWDLAEWQRELYAFARAAIAVRRSHAAFRQHHFFVGQPVEGARLKDLTWIAADGREADDSTWHAAETQTIGMYFAAEQADVDARGRRAQDVPLLVILHAGAEPVDFTLPAVAGGAETFEVLLRTDGDADGPRHAAGSALRLGGRTMVVLAGRTGTTAAQ